MRASKFAQGARRLPTPTPAEPSQYNALYVTNFAPHYQGDDLARGSEWLAVKPIHTRSPLQFDLSETLDAAINNYHRVPEIAEDGEILR